MPLNPSFSVTPLEPYVCSGDICADLTCSSTFLGSSVGEDLAAQFNQGKAVFVFASHPDPAPGLEPPFHERYANAFLTFRTAATTTDQYLLIFHISGRIGAKAAFYINGGLVHTEEVKGEQFVAILMDVASTGYWTYACMLHVGGGVLEFRGIEVYII